MRRAQANTTLLSQPQFDHMNLSVTLHASCYGGARTFTYFQSLRDKSGAFLPIAKQFFKGFEEYFLSSNIESVRSCRGLLGEFERLADTFIGEGFDDLADIPKSRFFVDGIDSMLSRPLAEAVRHSGHLEEETIKRLLYSQTKKRQRGQNRAEMSDDDVQKLRDRSWEMFKRVYDRHEAYTKGLKDWLPQGTDLSGRNWHDVPADVIINAARQRAEQTIRLSGKSVADVGFSPLMKSHERGLLNEDVLWDWLLLNPTENGRHYKQELFFGTEFRCAALVHHCFIDLRGFNLATMLNSHVDHIQSLGLDIDYVDMAKPRAGHLKSREFTHKLNIKTHLGGFLRAVAAVSKFSRYSMSQWAEPETAGLLYAGHHPVADPKLDTSKLDISKFNRLMKQDIQNFTLRFTELRLACARLGQVESPSHELHGQTRRTRTTYDKKALPDKMLHAEAEQAIEMFVEKGSARLRKAEENNTAKDFAVSVCVSGSADPDVPEEACRRPLTSCFTCPNSQRTFDHVPGLLAMQRFCLDLQQNNAFEWETSEAPSVLTAVTTVLEHAPDASVEHWQTEFKNNPLLAEQWETYVAVVWRQRSRK